MTNTPHTPAPWTYKLIHDADRNPVYVVNSGNPDIDGYHVCVTYCDNEIDASNAHLIAAAPELLELAKLVNNGAKQSKEKDIASLDELTAWVSEIRRLAKIAVQKAEGE